MSERLPEIELKRLFAVGMLKKPIKRPEDAYAIATSIFGSDTIWVGLAGANWPTDVEVRKIYDELLAEKGAAAFLPTKEEFAQACLEAANEKINGHSYLNEGRTRAQLLRLAAEVMGFIDKPAPPDKRKGKGPPRAIVFAPYPDQVPKVAE